MLEAALDEEQARQLVQHHETYKAMGLDATLLQGKELEAEIRSPRYVAALKFPYGGILNPAKLARGMKPVVERAGVEVRERTVVLRVTPGKVHRVETEMGEISAPVLVLGLNGYAPRLGFFRDRVLPLCSYVIATEPLTAAQWASIGWQHRQGIADMRVLFDYQRPTADGRIVIGGSDAPYFADDALSSGNYKPAIEALTASLFTTFPQLEGVRIDHAWGGTMGFTAGFHPVGRRDGRRQEHLLRRGLQRRRRCLLADGGAHHRRPDGGRGDRAHQALRGQPPDALPRSAQSAHRVRAPVQVVPHARRRKDGALNTGAATPQGSILSSCVRDHPIRLDRRVINT